MCAWTEMVMLQQRGVDCIFRLTSHRTADFRRGERLGKDDHIVKWMKPRKPRSIDRRTYDDMLSSYWSESVASASRDLAFAFAAWSSPRRC